MTKTVSLTKSDVEKYQKIHKAKFGSDIDYQEAYKQAMALVTLVSILAKPIENTNG